MNDGHVTSASVNVCMVVVHTCSTCASIYCLLHVPSLSLSQGISFLDGMRDLWYKRGWNKGEQHTDFRAEILKWLKLLLSVVKLTDPNAPSLLKKFLGNKRNSIVTDPEFRKSVTDQVLEDTRKNFNLLSIQQFFILYKSFRIWPLNVSEIEALLFCLFLIDNIV